MISTITDRITSLGRAFNTQAGASGFDWFNPSERYVIDFAPDFTSGGWLQFDTSSDAPCFGVWVNPGDLTTLSYAEGDWTLILCKDTDQYNAHVQAMIDCYDEGRICRTIDTETGQTTDYRQDRSTFLIDAETVEP